TTSGPGEFPAAKGEPTVGLKAPLLSLRRNTATPLDSGRLTNARRVGVVLQPVRPRRTVSNNHRRIVSNEIIVPHGKWNQDKLTPGSDFVSKPRSVPHMAKMEDDPGRNPDVVLGCPERTAVEIFGLDNANT